MKRECSRHFVISIKVLHSSLMCLDSHPRLIALSLWPSPALNVHSTPDLLCKKIYLHLVTPLSKHASIFFINGVPPAPPHPSCLRLLELWRISAGGDAVVGRWAMACLGPIFNSDVSQICSNAAAHTRTYMHACVFANWRLMRGRCAWMEWVTQLSHHATKQALVLQFICHAASIDCAVWFRCWIHKSSCASVAFCCSEWLKPFFFPLQLLNWIFQN